MNQELIDQLIAVAIKLTPEIIALIREIQKQSNPDSPVPTDAEVIAAYEAAFRSSLDKDARWLSVHGLGQNGT
jgi:hypothetical protein